MSEGIAVYGTKKGINTLVPRSDGSYAFLNTQRKKKQQQRSKTSNDKKQQQQQTFASLSLLSRF